MIQKRLSEDEYIRDEVTERVTAEVSITIARSLLSADFSIAEVAHHTGLSVDDVAEIASDGLCLQVVELQRWFKILKINSTPPPTEIGKGG